eukprot:scaffold65054_cov20-Tisochrysis_lutea.AAC.1
MQKTSRMPESFMKASTDGDCMPVGPRGCSCDARCHACLKMSCRPELMKTACKQAVVASQDVAGGRNCSTGLN